MVMKKLERPETAPVLEDDDDDDDPQSETGEEDRDDRAVAVARAGLLLLLLLLPGKDGEVGDCAEADAEADVGSGGHGVMASMSSMPAGTRRVAGFWGMVFFFSFYWCRVGIPRTGLPRAFADDGVLYGVRAGIRGRGSRERNEGWHGAFVLLRVFACLCVWLLCS